MPGKTVAPAAAFFWIACGFAALLALPLVYLQEHRFFARTEPYYSAPVVQTPPGTLRVRNDVIGKGDFGTSRSNNRTHRGVDLCAPMGSPVFAAKSGRVSFAGVDKGYGNYIELSHPDGLQTRYAHLSAIDVVRGEWVPRGTILGNAGKTGNASDPRVVCHLHFEIRRNQHAFNPLDHFLEPVLKTVET
jgi:murein DD-endopeptidase MepM/ murein hydrolase activator NlpD